MLEVELRTAPLDACRADPDAVAERIDRSTALVVAVAGSTEHGRVDPVSTLRDLAHDAGAPCHVDAARGGFALPFTEHGRDFADTPVDTMTIDPHRLEQAAVPAGALLAWDRPARGAVGVDPVPGDRLIGIAERDAIGGRGGHTAAALDALWPACYRASCGRTRGRRRLLIRRRTPDPRPRRRRPGTAARRYRYRPRERLGSL